MEDVFRAEVRATLRSFDNLYIFGTAGEGYRRYRKPVP